MTLPTKVSMLERSVIGNSTMKLKGNPSEVPLCSSQCLQIVCDIGANKFENRVITKYITVNKKLQKGIYTLNY